MRFVLLLLTTGLVGCTQIPVSELAEYREAFGQFRQVSDELLLDYDLLVKTADEVQNRGATPDAARPRPYPIAFKDFKGDQSEQPADLIEIRRQSLEVVARYNDVLVRLAEGKSVEEVQSSAESLVRGLGKLAEIASGAPVPGLGAFVGLVRTLTEQVEKARLRAEFAKAVRDGAPVIDQMLDLFMGDVADHYRLKAVVAEQQRLLILNDTTRLLAMVLGLAEHADLTGMTNEINEIVGPMGGELVEYPYRIEQPAAADPPTDRAAERARGQAAAQASGQAAAAMVELKELAVGYQDNVESVQAFGRALVQYQTLTQQLKRSLTALREAIDQRRDLSAIAGDMKMIAFSIRRDLKALGVAFGRS